MKYYAICVLDENGNIVRADYFTTYNTMITYKAEFEKQLYDMTNGNHGIVKTYEVNHSTNEINYKGIE